MDDLDRHLSASGLTPALVTELGLVDAVGVSTIRQGELKTLRPSSTDRVSSSEGVGYPVLKVPVITIDRSWSEQEREGARNSGDERLIKAADDERFGVAEQLAAGPLLQSTWNDGPDEGHPRGYALVAAAVDLARAGLSSPLTREQLHTAHATYLPAPPPLPEDADQAWEWATRPRSGTAGLLVLIDHEGLRWRAFDYLTTQRPLPEAAWHTALNLATEKDRFIIGITALRTKRFDIIEKAWIPLAERGEAIAMTGLGLLMEETGHPKNAEKWYRKSSKAGDTDAMVFLGILLEESDRIEEAEKWYREASELGDTHAMYSLGHLLEGTSHPEEAEKWYREASELGSTDAMVGLAILLRSTDRLDEAEKWYREASEL
ncbi:tetratricopeptide repeat protein [Nocardiopsis alba]|uniref:tetratricopeptide repeat protein n=1 Tax=Nocardiopsis alba TaxID=53437 RepID=UPI00366AE636